MIGKITEIPFNMFQEHAECHSSDFSSVCGLSVCFDVGFGKCFGLLSVVQYRSSFPGPSLPTTSHLLRLKGPSGE